MRGWRSKTPSWKTKSTKSASWTPSRTGPKSSSSSWTSGSIDKVTGYGKVTKGEVVFIHASVVPGAEVLTIGTARRRSSPGRYRACKAWGDAAWKEERDKERASKVAEHVRRAAASTAELAAQSQKKVSEVCSHPAGLHDEPAAAAPQATDSLSLVVGSLLPLGQSFSSDSGRFRGGQTTVRHASSGSSRLGRRSCEPLCQSN